MDADRLEEHRLWKHPSATDIAVVMHELEALAGQAQRAFDGADWLNMRLILDDLHVRVLRALTYADLEATKAVA
ncbi:hypothetical protein [Nocardia sp. NPDC004860]|uniref:hypothetical protein n=1 Tax=Nocardia sp. NPDC004860 TaxID=3154557 RepID=UPI0033A69FE4